MALRSREPAVPAARPLVSPLLWASGPCPAGPPRPGFYPVPGNGVLLAFTKAGSCLIHKIGPLSPIPQ